MGGGVQESWLRDEVARRGLDAVTFVPPVPFSEMTDVLALGDAHLVSLQDLPLFRTTLPSKLQATLAAGKPVVGAVAGDAATVIRESGAGVVVPPGDAAALAGAIAQLADAGAETVQALGRAARSHYLQIFSEEATSHVLLDLLHDAARPRPREVGPMTRIAVLGASGFVGSAVVEAARSAGHTVLPLKAPRLSAGDVGATRARSRTSPASWRVSTSSSTARATRTRRRRGSRTCRPPTVSSPASSAGPLAPRTCPGTST